MTLAATELVLGLMFAAVWLLVALVIAMPAKRSDQASGSGLSREGGRSDSPHARPELIIPRHRRRITARWAPRPLRD